MERNPLDGQVKVTLDLSGGPVSGAADSDAPEATDDDPSSFLESMGFGALGGMGGFELVGPGGDPGAVGTLQLGPALTLPPSNCIYFSPPWSAPCPTSTPNLPYRESVCDPCRSFGAYMTCWLHGCCVWRHIRRKLFTCLSSCEVLNPLKAVSACRYMICLHFALRAFAWHAPHRVAVGGNV